MGTTHQTRTQSPTGTVKLTSETLMRALGLKEAACTTSICSAEVQDLDGGGRAAIRAILGKPERVKVAGDASILVEDPVNKAVYTGPPDMAFVSEVLTSTRHKLAAAQKRFWSFVLPNGIPMESQLRTEFVKQAMAPFLQAAGMPQPMQQPATQAIPQHPAVPTAPPASTLPQGTGPAMPGHQTLTGIAQRPLGLDRPQDTRAAALPGSPGHAATNVIDQRGALDPRGLTIDGNNSASIKKFASFSVASWFREKTAAPLGGPIDPEEEKRKRRTPWQGIGLGGGLGLAGAASLGTAYGLASDKQIGRVRQAIQDYKPEAFTQGQLPPNHTGLTYYQKTMSPAAQLRPFGQPVGSALAALRSSPAAMKALGTENYALKSPVEQYGVSGTAHYNMFGNGPVPAYAHQLKAKLATQPVDPTMGAPDGTMYSDWMGRKFEDFVDQYTGQRINPFEFTTKFMPHEGQTDLMEKFYQSLPPEQQAYRMKMEDPGAGYADQVNNYLPKAEGFANIRDMLKNVGIAGLGAGAGAVGGNMLYDALNDDDPTNDSALMRALSTAGGAGLGGAAAYYGGTQPGRQAIQSLLSRITQSTKTAGANAYARGGMPKQAQVEPLRPVNADPDFIAANKSWHDAEKAKMASRRPVDPDFLARAAVQNLLTSLGVKAPAV